MKPRRMFSLGLIVSELLTRALQRDFGGAARRGIEIVLSKRASHVVLAIRDNGSPSPEVPGDDLAGMLAAGLGGSLLAASEKGPTSALEFDLQ